MPHKKSAKTLFELCVDNVVKEMDCMWRRKPIEDLDVVVDSEISFTLLDELPTAILEELVCALKKKNLLENHLRWIITPKLNTLDLTIKCWKRSQEEAVKKEMFQHFKHASITCPMLKVLILHGSSVPDEETLGFLNILPTFTNLQVLDISNTLAGDKCFWILGTHCKHLRCLNANNCYEVTDFGIQGLCLDYVEREKDEDEQQDSKTRKTDDPEMRERCTPPRLSNSMETLRLDETEVTKKGIAEALTKLRSLRVLEHQSTVKVLAEMHKADFESEEDVISKYELSEIIFTVKDFQISRNRLWRAVSLCESISVLNISKIGVSDGYMEGIFIDTEGYQRFDLEIIPILKMIGNSLRELSLYLCSVNTFSVSDCCPNLRKLKLDYGRCSDFLTADEQSERSNYKEKKTFPKLEKLELSCVDISSESLLSLISSSSLKSIVIWDCNTLTDDMLQEASNLNFFPNLEYFELYECDFVTEIGINVLLEESNPLKKIKISTERSLTREKEDWNDKIALNNWQLEIEVDKLMTSGEIYAKFSLEGVDFAQIRRNLFG